MIKSIVSIREDQTNEQLKVNHYEHFRDIMYAAGLFKLSNGKQLIVINVHFPHMDNYILQHKNGLNKKIKLCHTDRERCNTFLRTNAILNYIIDVLSNELTEEFTTIIMGDTNELFEILDKIQNEEGSVDTITIQLGSHNITFANAGAHSYRQNLLTGTTPSDSAHKPTAFIPKFTGSSSPVFKNTSLQDEISPDVIGSNKRVTFHEPQKLYKENSGYFLSDHYLLTGEVNLDAPSNILRRPLNLSEINGIFRLLEREVTPMDGQIEDFDPVVRSIDPPNECPCAKLGGGKNKRKNNTKRKFNIKKKSKKYNKNKRKKNTRKKSNRKKSNRNKYNKKKLNKS